MAWDMGRHILHCCHQGAGVPHPQSHARFPSLLRPPGDPGHSEDLCRTWCQEGPWDRPANGDPAIGGWEGNERAASSPQGSLARQAQEPGLWGGLREDPARVMRKAVIATHNTLTQLQHPAMAL